MYNVGVAEWRRGNLCVRQGGVKAEMVAGPISSLSQGALRVELEIESSCITFDCLT